MPSTAKSELCPVCTHPISEHNEATARLHYLTWLRSQDYRRWIGDPPASPSWH